MKFIYFSHRAAPFCMRMVTLSVGQPGAVRLLMTHSGKCQIAGSHFYKL